VWREVINLLLLLLLLLLQQNRNVNWSENSQAVSARPSGKCPKHQFNAKNIQNIQFLSNIKQKLHDETNHRIFWAEMIAVILKIPQSVVTSLYVKV